MRLRGKLVVGSLHNGVHRTGLLAESTVDALGHVDIVSCGTTGPVLAGLGLDRNGLSGANRLAELARNAALVARGVSPQGVLSAESGTQVAPFVGVVDGDLGLEANLQGEREAANNFGQKEDLGGPVKDGFPWSLKENKKKIAIVRDESVALFFIFS